MLSAKDNCRPAAAGSPARKHGGLRMADDPNFGIRVKPQLVCATGAIPRNLLSL